MAKKVNNKVRVSFTLAEEDLFSMYYAISHGTYAYPSAVSPLLWALFDHIDQDKYDLFCREHYYV